MSTPDDLMDAAQQATSELKLADMTGPQLAGWAAEHVMGWEWREDAAFHRRFDLPGWAEGDRLMAYADDWHPDTDWNDARRVLLAASIAAIFMNPHQTPLDLLRYVCEQWEKAHPHDKYAGKPEHDSAGWRPE
jgi:hypothetical protein